MICFNKFEFKQMLWCIECVHDKESIYNFPICSDFKEDGSMIECDVRKYRMGRLL